MAQHPHPQLIAHSQLTNLTPSQFQYIQIPTSLLSSATNNEYHQPLQETSRAGSGGNHFVLQSASLFPNGSSTNEFLVECVICFGAVAPNVISTAGRRPFEIFEKICDIFHVPLQEVLYEWNFEEEHLPLCQDCMNATNGLFSLQDELNTIQKYIWNGIENIRAKIRDSNERLSTFDIRTINIRNKLLAPDTPSAAGLPTSSSFQSDHHQQMDQSFRQTMPPTGCGTVSEFNGMLNPQLNGMQYPVTNIVIQEEFLSPPPPPQQQYVVPLSSPGDSITFSTLEQLTAPLPTCETQPSFSLTNNFFSPVISNSPDKEMTVTVEDTSVITTCELEDPTAQIFLNTTETETNSAAVLNGDISVWNLEDVEQEISKVPFTNPPNQPPSPVPTIKQYKRRKSSKSEVVKDVTETTGSKNSKTKADLTGIQCSVKKYECFAPTQTDESGTMLFEGITIIPSETGYACGKCLKICGKRKDTIGLRKIKVHIKGVHLGAYQCDLCNKNFASNSVLSQHKQRTHDKKHIPCDICGRPMRARSITKHKFTHMNDEEKAISISNGFKLPKQLEGQIFTCAICGKSFGSKSILVRHESSHLGIEARKKYECNICSNPYTNASSLKRHKLRAHDSMGNKRKLTCKYCGRLLPCGYFHKHAKKHLPKGTHKIACGICGAPLRNFRARKHHEARHDPSHTPEMFKFECDFCEKRFMSSQQVELHQKESHEGNQGRVGTLLPTEDFTIEEDSTQDAHPEDTTGIELVEQNMNMAHKRAKHMNKPDRRCSICGSPDVPNHTMKVHTWSHGGLNDMVDAINIGDQLPTKSLNLSENYEITLRNLGVQLRFTCGFCSSEFQSVKSLYKHRHEDRCGDLKANANTSSQSTQFGKENNKKKDRNSHPEKQVSLEIVARSTFVDNEVISSKLNKKKRSVNKESQKDVPVSKIRSRSSNATRNHRYVHPSFKVERTLEEENFDDDRDLLSKSDNRAHRHMSISSKGGPRVKKKGTSRRPRKTLEQKHKTSMAFAAENIRLPDGLQSGYTIEYIYPSEEEDTINS